MCQWSSAPTLSLWCPFLHPRLRRSNGVQGTGANSQTTKPNRQSVLQLAFRVRKAHMQQKTTDLPLKPQPVLGALQRRRAPCEPNIKASSGPFRSIGTLLRQTPKRLHSTDGSTADAEQKRCQF